MVFSTSQFFTCLGFTLEKRQKKFYGSCFQEFDSCRGDVCYITLRVMLNWYDKGRHNKDLSPLGRFIWQKSFKIIKDFKVFQTPQYRFSRITEVSKTFGEERFSILLYKFIPWSYSPPEKTLWSLTIKTG